MRWQGQSRPAATRRTRSQVSAARQFPRSQGKSAFGTAGSLKGEIDVLVPTVPVVLYIRAAGYRDWYYPGTSIAARARPLKVSAKQTLKLQVIMQKLP